jgi:predicted transcriptional regulator
MQRNIKKTDKTIDQIFTDIFKSRVKARIYTYLLRKNAATSEDLAKHTGFYPSTIREALSEMFEQNIIYRKKLKKDSRGKNPYLYYPASPLKLLKNYIKDVEARLNKIASISNRLGRNNKFSSFRIKVELREGDQR